MGSYTRTNPPPGSVTPVIDAHRSRLTSEQATRATDLYRRKYTEFRPNPGLTYLFEIIYPGNRIVVDYGATEDLILLAVIDHRKPKVDLRFTLA